ncbi:MAG: LysR family transcriptional regulator [Oscillospiraceae bacterium]
MDTKQLEYILTIAEEKSVSRAAEKLFLSQSALSQQLAKLKVEGLPPLFYRCKGEMLLTDAGKIYINGARIIMKIYEDTNNLLHNRNGNQIKHLKLSICRRLQPLVYTRLLPLLKHAYPTMEVTVSIPVSLQVRRTIVDGEIDLSVFSAVRHVDEDMNYTVLAEEELVLAVPSENEFGDLPVILPPQGSHLRLICDKAFQEKGRGFDVYAESDDISVMLNLVKQAECTAIVPRSCLKGVELQAQSFSPPIKFDTVAACRKGQDMPLLRETIGILQTLISEK